MPFIAYSNFQFGDFKKKNNNTFKNTKKKFVYYYYYYKKENINKFMIEKKKLYLYVY